MARRRNLVDFGGEDYGTDISGLEGIGGEYVDINGVPYSITALLNWRASGTTSFDESQYGRALRSYIAQKASRTVEERIVGAPVEEAARLSALTTQERVREYITLEPRTGRYEPQRADQYSYLFDEDLEYPIEPMKPSLITERVKPEATGLPPGWKRTLGGLIQNEDGTIYDPSAKTYTLVDGEIKTQKQMETEQTIAEAEFKKAEEEQAKAGWEKLPDGNLYNSISGVTIDRKTGNFTIPTKSDEFGIGYEIVTPEDMLARSEKAERLDKLLSTVFPKEDVLEIKKWAVENPAELHNVFAGKYDDPNALAVLSMMGFSAPEIQYLTRPIESWIKDQWDTLHVSWNRMWNEGFKGVNLQNMTTFKSVTSPATEEEWQNYMIASDMPDTPETRASMSRIIEIENAYRGEYRASFMSNYNHLADIHEQWMRSNPGYLPRDEWLRPADEIFASGDSALITSYIAYQCADNAAFTLSALVAGVAGGALGGAYGSALAVTAVTSPMITAQMYEDLIASGCPPEDAPEVASLLGIAVASVEVVGELPVIGQITKGAFGGFNKIISRAFAKGFMRVALERGITRFTLSTMMSFISESAEEIGQAIMQDATMSVYDKQRGVLDVLKADNLLQIATVIAPMSLAFGGVGFFQAKAAYLPPEIRKAIIDEIQTTPSLAKDFEEAIAEEEKIFTADTGEVPTVENGGTDEVESEAIKDVIEGNPSGMKEVEETVTEKIVTEYYETEINTAIAAKPPVQGYTWAADIKVSELGIDFSGSSLGDIFRIFEKNKDLKVLDVIAKMSKSERKTLSDDLNRMVETYMDTGTLIHPGLQRILDIIKNPYRVGETTKKPVYPSWYIPEVVTTKEVKPGEEIPLGEAKKPEVKPPTEGKAPRGARAIAEKEEGVEIPEKIWNKWGKEVPAQFKGHVKEIAGLVAQTGNAIDEQILAAVAKEKTLEEVKSALQPLIEFSKIHGALLQIAESASTQITDDEWLGFVDAGMSDDIMQDITHEEETYEEWRASIEKIDEKTFVETTTARQIDYWWTEAKGIETQEQLNLWLASPAGVEFLKRSNERSRILYGIIREAAGLGKTEGLPATPFVSGSLTNNLVEAYNYGFRGLNLAKLLGEDEEPTIYIFRGAGLKDYIGPTGKVNPNLRSFGESNPLDSISLVKNGKPVSITEVERLFELIKSKYPNEELWLHGSHRKAETKEAIPETIKTVPAFRETMYQGKGASLETVYGKEAVEQGRAVPLFGEGTYFAFNEKDAKQFGTVTKHDVVLTNPYLLDSDKKWFALIKEAETPHLDNMSELFYTEPEKVAGETQKLQDYLKSKGYDGIIVRLAEDSDLTKRLNKVAGDSQVVVFYHEKSVFPAKAVKPEAEAKKAEKPKQGGLGLDVPPPNSLLRVRRQREANEIKGPTVLPRLGGKPHPVVEAKAVKEFVKEYAKVKKPIKIHEVIREISKKTGVEIRYNIMGMSRNASGIYIIEQELIRWQQGGIGTVSHEVGHYFDSTYSPPNMTLAKSIVTPGEKNSLLRDYADKEADIGEAFAELLRFYITEPAYIQNMQSFKNLQEWLGSYKEIDDFFRALQTIYQRYKLLPVTGKLAAMMSSGEKLKGPDLATSYRRFFIETFDEKHYIKYMSDIAKSDIGNIKPDEDFALLMRQHSGVIPKARLMLEKGTFGRQYLEWVDGKPKFKKKGPAFQEVILSIKDNELETFDIYLVNKRAIEKASQGIQTVGEISGTELDMSIKEIETSYPHFKAASEGLYKFQRQVLEYLVESHVLAQEDFDRIVKANLMYVPFYRYHEMMLGSKRLGSKITSLKKGIYKLSNGVELPIISPLESIVKNTISLIDLADRNYIGTMLAKAASQSPALGQAFSLITTPQRKVASLTGQQFIESLEANDDIKKELMDIMEENNLLELAVDIWRPMAYSLDPTIQTVRVNGKPKFFQVLDPDLRTALMASSAQDFDMFFKFISYPAKWLRAGATTFSPDFLLANNPIRDTGSVAILNNFGFVPGIDTVRGVIRILQDIGGAKDNDIYELAMASGVAHSALVSLDRDYLKQSLDDILKAKGAGKLRYLKHPLDLLQRISEISDMSTRLGVYEKVLMKTHDPTTAGFTARDDPLDFSIRGASKAVKALTGSTAFLNPRLRGAERMYRAFIGRPSAGAYMRVMAGIIIPTIMLWMANRDDERYKELPSWQRVMFWNFWLSPDQKEPYRLLKPGDIGMFFGGFTEMICEWLDNNPEYVAKALPEIGKQFVGVVIPTAVIGAVEWKLNYDFFRERPVVSEAIANSEAPWSEYYNYTPESYKWLANHLKELPDWLGKGFVNSPAQFQNFVENWFGTASRYVVSGVDLLLESLGLIVIPPKPADPTTFSILDWDIGPDTPVFRTLIGRNPYGLQSESVVEFYQVKDELFKRLKALKFMIKEGDEVGYYDFMKKNPDSWLVIDIEKGELKSPVYVGFETFTGEFKKLRENQKRIYDDVDLTDIQKRAAIEDIDLKITHLAQEAMAFIKKIRAGDISDLKIPKTQLKADPTLGPLYNYMAEAPSFIRDYLWENKDKLNLTDSEITNRVDALVDWKFENKKLLLPYEELSGRPQAERLDYLIANPEIDAILNFNGQTTSIHSTEATKLLKERADEMGIPYEVFPALAKYEGDKILQLIEKSGKVKTFQLYDAYSDKTDPRYIENDASRIAARNKLLMSKDEKGNYAFATAYYSREALQKEFPVRLIENYIAYKQLDRTSPYEDDRFLMDHPDFQQVTEALSGIGQVSTANYFYLGLGNTVEEVRAKLREKFKTDPLEVFDILMASNIIKEKDFTKVPSRKVEQLYKDYQDESAKGPAYGIAFRVKHPDLQRWGELALGWKPIGDRGLEVPPKPKKLTVPAPRR